MGKDGCGGDVGTEVRYQKIDIVYIVLYDGYLVEVFSTKELANQFINYLVNEDYEYKSYHKDGFDIVEKYIREDLP